MDDPVYVVYKVCGCIGMVLRRHSGEQTRFLQRLATNGEHVEAFTERQVADLNYHCAFHSTVRAMEVA